MRSKFKWIFTLLIAFTMQFSFAQEKTVTGVVSDGSGPLPGANVVIKGTAKGVSTDVDGRYAIKAKQGDVLVFSSINYLSQSVTVGGASSYNVKLKEEAKVLDEVVVTSLNIKKKAGAITSSNQVIKAKELNQASSPNVVQSLVGKVSGLNINTTNSGVSPTTRIVIRTNKTISGDNTALIVIDGAISSAGALSRLDPDTVESVNTMKGAQGSALYGSDGVNGVIIVTTKKGSGSDKLNVKIGSSVDFENLAFLPTRQTRYGQGWNGQNVSYENGAWGAEFDGTMVAVGLPQEDGSYVMAPYVSRGSDNIKEFFKTGTLYQNRISLSAGKADDYIYFAAENQNRGFVVDGDKYVKNNFLFKAGKKVGKFTFDGNVSYNGSKTSQANALLYDDLIQTATNIPVSLFANSGNAGHWSVYTRNPYWSIENDRTDSNSNSVNGIARIQYDLNKNINVVYTANVRLNSVDGLSFTNAYKSAYPTPPVFDNSVTSHFSASNSSSRSIYADLMFNLNYDLTKDLNLKMNLGNNIQDILGNNVGVGGNNLAIDNLYVINSLTGLPTFDTNNTFNSSSRFRQFSYFGQMDLGYKDFLFLNVTGRNDWISTLAKDKRSYFYPSTGLSFVPTAAFPSIKGKTLKYAKIYANYTKVGKTGDVGVYSINSLYSAEAGYPMNGVSSYGQNTGTTDPNIRPEMFTTKEAGINLSFFNDRLTLDAAAYKTDSKDLITNITPSFTSGFTTTRINIGLAQTEGFEVDLGITPIKTENFRWDNRFGFSKGRMIVKKVSDQATSVQVTNGYAATANYNVGIFAEEGEEYPMLKGSAYQRDPLGRVIIDAATGMPLITSEYQKLGKVAPDYTLNYNTSFEYKGVRLSAVMEYRKGGHVYSQTMNRLSTFGYLVESAQGGRTGFIYPNSVVETSPGVYAPNTSVVTGGNTYSSYLNYNNDNFTEVAENFVLDATAFKVRELALSYSFSKKILSKAKLDALTLGVNARNPFIKLPKANRGYTDPESSVTSGNAQGFQYTGQYPSTRSLGFSINLTF